MARKKEIEVYKSSPSTRTLLVGALVGAGAGLISAMLLRRRSSSVFTALLVLAPLTGSVRGGDPEAVKARGFEPRRYGL